MCYAAYSIWKSKMNNRFLFTGNFWGNTLSNPTVTSFMNHFPSSLAPTTHASEIPRNDSNYSAAVASSKEKICECLGPVQSCKSCVNAKLK